jgi:hypothetical protein
MLDPVVFFERAACNAATMAANVRPDQRDAATPCTAWDVEALLAHMVAGTGYLLGALGIDAGPVATDAASYPAGVSRCVDALHVWGCVGRSVHVAGRL